MLGFHRRTRSLIPVKDLAKYDTVPVTEDDELDLETQIHDGSFSVDKPRQRRQLLIVYLVFLSEAIMASSLQPQLQMLLSSSDYCGNMSTSYLRSILDCAYAFGGTTGLFWGYLADRMGRRRVTLIGLWFMTISCLSMGFTTSLAGCALFRFLAGVASSAVVCTSLTMIGDLSTTSQGRAKDVARLPFISVCGSLGPILQGMVSESLQSYGMLWEKFPVLGSALACGTLVFAVTMITTFALQETLPTNSEKTVDTIDMDCERAACLRRDSEETTSTLVDFTRPEPITIAHFMQAPSLVVLLSSFCLVSLHSSTFDVVLPHLGHSSSEHGGMGIQCGWLSIAVLIVRGIAGLAIALAIPRAMQKYGLVTLYRSVSLMFPAVYIITPFLVFFVGTSGFAPIVSVLSLFSKHLLTGGASVLVALLVLNTTPDAFSTGTIVGMMQIASLFRSFAVAVSGTSYYFNDDVSITTTNSALWLCLAVFGVVGAGLAWFVKERPSVEKDFPSEVLCWETCFDADAEKQKSFDSDDDI